MAAKAKTKARTQKRPARSGSTSRRPSRRPRARGHAALATVARNMTEEVEQRPVPKDAIALLEHDHREVEELFDRFEEAEDNTEKAELARKICVALTVHAELEESTFYGTARKAIGEDELFDEAEVEHASAKQLIAEIEAMTPSAKLFDAKVKVLGEYVKHHVKEEEHEMFPKVRDSDLDLEGLAEKMMARKMKILQKLGRA